MTRIETGDILGTNIITLNRYDYFEPLSTTVPIPTWGYIVSTYFMVDRDRLSARQKCGCVGEVVVMMELMGRQRGGSVAIVLLYVL